jgi:predicted O-methyltransferase YrrM
MYIPTVARVVEKSVRHPFRAVRKTIQEARFALLDKSSERERLFTFLHNAFDADTDALQRDFELSGFADWMSQRRQKLAEFPGPYRFASTGEWDCEALYYVVRALRPRKVVETGVCYGASSAYILAALDRNGMGELHSIDLGNPPHEPPSHFFAHPAHRHRWNLIIGDCVHELPRLLQRLGQIDQFHHDSLHTYEHMMWEYRTAFAHLAPDGVLSSDDVNIILKLRQPFQRSPFLDFCDEHHWRGRTFRNLGVAVNALLERPESGGDGAFN